MVTQTLTILISLIFGIVTGAVMHRSDFCVAGMFRDLFLFRNSPLLRCLLLLIGLSLLLFTIARQAELISTATITTLYGQPALTNLLGGALFGIGMVLAGGCAIGTLYKLGAGNLPAAGALIGLLGGSVLYAEFHPQWQQLTIATRLSEATTLPQLLAIQPTLVTLVLLTLLLVPLCRWQRAGQLTRPAVIKGYLQPRTAALLLAVIGLLSFILLGMPLGVTTSYAKTGVFFEQLLIPEHVASLPYFQNRGFHYFSPLSNQTLSAGAGPFLDGLSLVQFPLIIGIVLGAAISALLLGKFQCRFDVPKKQLFSALVGGILMGLAARMSPACNIWHLFGGLPLLSLQSTLFTLGLFPGAWLGTRLLTRYVLPHRS